MELEQTTNLKFAEAVVDAFKTINSKIKNPQDHISIRIDNNVNLCFISNDEYISPTVISVSNNGEKIIAKPENNKGEMMVMEFRFPINNYKDELIHFIDLLACYRLIGDEAECAVIRDAVKYNFNNHNF